MATHSSILAWRIPWTEDPVGNSPTGLKESDMTEQLSTHITLLAIFKSLKSFKNIHFNVFILFQDM